MNNIRHVFILLVAYLYILLFTYAAVSKLLDLENFQMQIGQSPLLSAFANWVSYLVPLSEIFIVLLLLIPKCRTIGFYCCFSLMTMFTVYIYIILNYSSFIPCSCGGLLEELSWSQHLVFNIFFVLLAAIAITLQYSRSGNFAIRQKKRLALSLVMSALLSSGVVLSLFLISEDIVHRRNNFVRRFPHQPNQFLNEIDLKMNSYYVAGIGNGNIYLGNVTAPLHMTTIDTALQVKQELMIDIGKFDLPYRSIRIKISGSYFYVVDGTIPFVLRGKINNWSTTHQLETQGYFSLSTPIDSTTFVVRSRSSTTNENVLGIMRDHQQRIYFSDDLLQKQIDGVFDTDGMLLYNHQLQNVIYTYYYRNQFILTDPSLSQKRYGKTIDTISKAQIKIAYIPSKKESKMIAPPLTVNKKTATYGNYLFIHSGLIGRFEPIDHWDRASIIDVYNIKNNTYAFSFYIPNKGKDKLTEFHVSGNLLVCLVGNYMVTYHLTDRVFDTSLQKE